MTQEIGASPPLAATTVHRRDRALRARAFSMVVLILVQYALGMWVNLFATIPAADKGKGILAGFGAAVAHGPAALAVHAVLGTLLLLFAIEIVVLAARARRTDTLVLSVIGLLAIIGAWINGATFIGSQANGSSFGMAMSAGVAVLCNVIIVFLMGRHR